ncbi:MAG: SUMF1/EgtB/PvdO family nonheme iron enzyme, partial [Thermoguttaceae bacterium]|nr:SUMF1/EgtB/PvdO family nonheme iron enzyme [Thermoguttaceae bacterium]
MRWARKTRRVTRPASLGSTKFPPSRRLRLEPLERRDLLSLDIIAHGSTAISMDFVTVGNPGNAPDTETGYGAVGYTYRIGKYEVRESDWDAVSNASASDLLNDPGYWAANQPVTAISWHEAAMFTNWLTSGDVRLGVYTIDSSGRVTGIDRTSALSTYGTIYFLPTENEWYKAAYYDPNKPGGAGYWDYPTKHDDPNVPVGIHLGDNTFDAVFNQGYNQGRPNGYWEAGLLSAYGTMGQGGNVFEWTETTVETGMGSWRRVRGGAWGDTAEWLHAAQPHQLPPTDELTGVGFRVASMGGDRAPVAFDDTYSLNI